MVEPTKPPLPWSFLLLGASAAALVLSAVLYGLPSLLITVVAAWRLTRKRTHRDPILLAALLLGVTGAVLGMALSRLWWTSD